MKYSDTIVAHATPPGYGSIGILRVSGFKAQKIAEEVLGKVPKPRYADYLPFKDTDGSVLDYGIALWFPSPNSFTGEDVLELQGHCGPVVLDLLLRRILTLSDVRIAKPGEFSERAFLNKKLDLIQAEAIADLINASSEQAARSALHSFQGEFSIRINYLIETLVDLRTYVETIIDFSNEEDLILSKKNTESQLNQLINNLDSVHTAANYGNILREGIKVVIVGHPNVGKSSLLNALTGKKAAIVTNIAGTTRDPIFEHICIDGIPLHIIDTAGLRDNVEDEVERIGIERAWQAIKQADRILFMVDATTTDATSLIDIWSDVSNFLPNDIPITVIRNKIDLNKENPCFNNENNYPLIHLSAQTGEGIDLLRNHLKQCITLNSNTEGRFIARRRHLEALERAENHILQGKIKFTDILAWELLAEELRLAHQALNEITGTSFTSDELLGHIFSNFCIGK